MLPDGLLPVYALSYSHTHTHTHTHTHSHAGLLPGLSDGVSSGGSTHAGPQETLAAGLQPGSYITTHSAMHNTAGVHYTVWSSLYTLSDFRKF